MAFAREEVDPEAVKILAQAGFTWDPQTLGFRRGSVSAAESGAGSVVIDYEFLRDQKLIVGSELGRSERTGQLLRLRILLQSLN
jgi:hypothetical protein